MFNAKTTIPSKENSLPGRLEKMPVPAEHHVIKGAALEPPVPAGLQQALFALGCFWGAEKKFWQTPGVYTTAVGYTAGHTPHPTYREVCTLLLSACNTMEGMGQDIQKGGEKLENKAEDAK